MKHTELMPPVLILAGGIGSRLYPLTKSVPKSLIPIDGKPFIDHQLKLLKEKGIRDVILCIGYLGEQIQDYVGDGSRYELNISYSSDRNSLKRTGGAIRGAISLIKHASFWVMYGDSYLDISFAEIWKYYNSTQCRALMTTIKNRNLWDRSNVVFAEGVIKHYDKTNFRKDMHYIDYGLTIFNKDIFNDYMDIETFDLATLLADLTKKKKLAGYEVFNRFFEIGTERGLLETEQFIKKCSLENSRGNM